MTIAGELVSFLISLVQEIGVVAGVGALTITLIGHLLALHARIPEATLAYMRAARRVRAVALVLIVLSGAAAVLVHVQTGTVATLVAPAFLFKWGIIIILASYYFIERRVTGWALDAIEGSEGANWYALLIVHTIAPAVGWGLLMIIYAGWIVVFAAIWAGFVIFMRRQTTLPSPATKAASTNAPLLPSSTLTARRDVGTPVPSAAPMPPPSAAIPKVAPPAQTKEIMVAELDLPAPATPPVPVPPAEIVENLPGLRVMPKKPDEIESANRISPIKQEQEK